MKTEERIANQWVQANQRFAELASAENEPQKAKEILQASEMKYRLLVENSPDIIYILDPEGHFCLVEGAVESLLGFTAEELIGKHFTSAIWPGDINKAKWVFFERRTVKRSAKGFEVRMITKEGTGRHVDIKYLPVELHSFGLYDKSASTKEKRFLGTYGVARDITELKRAEEALKQSEEQYRLLVENANEAIFVSQDQMLKFVNPKTIEITGYSKEELTCRNFVDFIHPADREMVLNQEQELLTDESIPRVCSFRIVDKKGNIRWVETNVVRILWEGRSATLNLNSDITDRRRAEESLKEQLVLMQTLCDTLPSPVFYKDMDGKYKGCNKAFEEFVGRSREEIVGKTEYEIGPRDMAAKCHERDQELLHNPGQQLYECEVTTKSGKLRDVIFNKATYTDKDDKVAGLIGVISDITDHKRVQETLEKERDNAQRYLDIAGVMIIALDNEGKVTLINKKGCEVLGYREEEIVGKDWFDNVLPKRLRNEVKAVFRKLMAGDVQPVQCFENPVLTKTGEERIIAWYNIVLSDEEGNIIGHLSSGDDISERKLAEYALRESENRLRTLLENLPQKIFYKDSNSVYVSCNENFAQDLRIKPEEIRGKTDHDFFLKELAEKYREDDRRIMASGKIEDIDEEYVQDGEEIYVHTVKTPVNDEKGTSTGILGIFWDVTEQKLAQEELRKYREGLEQLVDCRTKELRDAQEQLVRQEKLTV